MEVVVAAVLDPSSHQQQQQKKQKKKQRGREVGRPYDCRHGSHHDIASMLAAVGGVSGPARQTMLNAPKRPLYSVGGRGEMTT